MPVIVVLFCKVMVTIPTFSFSFCRCLNGHFLNMFWIGALFHMAPLFHVMFKPQTTSNIEELNVFFCKQTLL